jgi:hypothetical protein
MRRGATKQFVSSQDGPAGISVDALRWLEDTDRQRKCTPEIIGAWTDVFATDSQETSDKTEFALVKNHFDNKSVDGIGAW